MRTVRSVEKAEARIELLVVMRHRQVGPALLLHSSRLAMIRIALLVALLPASLVRAEAPSHPARVIPVDAKDLARAVRAAPPHAVLVADRAEQVEVSETVRVDKPLTLVGLNMRLRPGLGKVPILEVLSEDVQIREFVLVGNGDSVEQADRAPLIVVRRGRFVIENGRTDNSAKDGVMITPEERFGDIEHGVVRNLTARGTIRDVVSIGGRGDRGLFVRHLVVENIRSYGSKLRGPVEVSDGSEHITVRDIYAESSFYGVDVQDHSRPGMVNRHVLIDGVQVRDCVTAIRTANRDFGHDGLTIRNVSGSDFRAGGSWSPLHVRNTSNVVIENVLLAGGPLDRPWLMTENVRNLTLRNVTVVGAAHDGAAIEVRDPDTALLDNLVVSGDARPGTAVNVVLAAQRRLGPLRIRNVVATGARDVGIAVSGMPGAVGLDASLITDNLATVRVAVDSARTVLERNL